MDKPSRIFDREIPVGAVVNGIPLAIVEGVAHGGYGTACVGYEVGATPLFGEPSRKGGSRVYVKLRRNRGDLKFNPVNDDAGNLVGVEIASSGDDAGKALAAALIEIVDKLYRKM